MARLGFDWLLFPPLPLHLGAQMAAEVSGLGKAVEPRCHEVMTLWPQEPVFTVLRDAQDGARTRPSIPAAFLHGRGFQAASEQGAQPGSRSRGLLTGRRP